jgi:hypothetical protein
MLNTDVFPCFVAKGMKADKEWLSSSVEELLQLKAVPSIVLPPTE